MSMQAEREGVELVLDISQGVGPAHRHSYAEFPARIGRDDGSAICLTGLWVGKCHTEIRLGHGGLMVFDQGTLAGTLVNNVRVSEYGPLRSGDVLQVGGWRLEVLSVGQPVAHAELAVQDAVDRGVRKLRQLIDLRRKDWQGVSDDVVRAECRDLIAPFMDELIGPIAVLPQSDYLEHVIAESVGLGPLEQLFTDPEITEIMVNRFDEIFVERSGRCERVELRFSSEDSVRSVVDRIVSPLGKRIDDASPMVDARLVDGSRVNAIIKPLAVKGSSLTIRRFAGTRLGPKDLLARHALNDEMLRFLELVVAHRFNVVVSGGTGSGKTTLLNILSGWIPGHERLVTIEDAAELRLGHANLVSLEVRQANSEGQGSVSMRDLLRNALRMRPDRIVVGECRGGEALDMLQAMNTGHEGSLTTLHANSPRDALARLEVMVLMAGFDLPLLAIREQIASAVDVIVQQQRCADGHRRIVSISEVTGVETGVIQTQEIFSWRPDLGQYRSSGVVPHCVDRLTERGVAVDLESITGTLEPFA